ncbi:tissue factor pathway inhibitor isoform X2 [Varanus komodoensis]|uniref:tissue factor pathway inhibitor isoform X2 n=1 Tax=Varanus komodoensis TaxID=61221 RepID=UPI001CF7CF6E|nr:tissue factor pathway inhibitor isoform X2 [Varanus komodoensis]
MRMDAFVSAIGCILFSLVAFQVTAAPQDEEENEDFIVHVLPPLKLGLPICAFKADSGPCKAINNRYHFNIQTRQCEMFNYGGCEGNANNFQTLEECQEKCIVPDFPETRKRTKFKTGIERPSYCLLESQPGICRALFSRYFYNKETQMCENFFYSGCLGNRNNFLSLKECQDTCQGSFPSGNSWQTENDSLPFGETNNSAPVAKRVTSANSLQTKEDSVLLSIKNNSSPVVKQVVWEGEGNSWKKTDLFHQVFLLAICTCTHLGSWGLADGLWIVQTG